MQLWSLLCMFNLLSKRMMSQQRAGIRLLSTKRPNPPPIVLNENDLRESFVRGSGPGGQKINKSKNNVHLLHIPSGLVVQCQETRDLASNRKIARKLLRDKLDLATNGEDSKLGRRFEKIRKKKRTAARRADKKYGKDEQSQLCTSEGSDAETEPDDDDTDTDHTGKVPSNIPTTPPPT